MSEGPAPTRILRLGPGVAASRRRQRRLGQAATGIALFAALPWLWGLVILVGFAVAPLLRPLGAASSYGLVSTGYWTVLAAPLVGAATLWLASLWKSAAGPLHPHRPVATFATAVAVVTLVVSAAAITFGVVLAMHID